jgi:phosphoadenosine phosphosulfate reductase
MRALKITDGLETVSAPAIVNNNQEPSVTQASLSRLQTFYGHLEAEELLRVMIKDEFKDRIALLSSFGADSALLISMVAKIDPATKILFLETRKHFTQTLEYVEQLKTQFGLTNLIYLTPNPKLIQNIDKEGTLWNSQPNRCCWLRKVEPLDRGIKEHGIEAVITGRKSYQTEDRSNLPSIELDEKGIFRINPLITWDKHKIRAAFEAEHLPQHPLVAEGYLSIGCEPCTRPVKAGENERAGRWAHTAEMPGGEQKTECGIHIESTPDWSV